MFVDKVVVIHISGYFQYFQTV